RSDLLSPAEKETVRRYIPWTYRVADQKVEFEGGAAHLPHVPAAARDKLVLKEGANYGGKGVFLGRFTSAPRWDELVRQALESGNGGVQELRASSVSPYQ